VTGIEPVTPCLQSSGTISHKPSVFNLSIENPRLNHSEGVWLDISGCRLLLIGSLQKSLQVVRGVVA